MAVETYKRKVDCTNCTFNGEIDIEKGITVNKAACPECGNTTLVADDPIETTSYR